MQKSHYSDDSSKPRFIKYYESLQKLLEAKLEDQFARENPYASPSDTECYVNEMLDKIATAVIELVEKQGKGSKGQTSSWTPDRTSYV